MGEGAFFSVETFWGPELADVNLRPTERVGLAAMTHKGGIA